MSGVNRYWIVSALLLIHGAFQWQHLQLDFWNDELYTLEHFVLKPAWAASHDYHSTNNHVLFSLLGQAWANLLGINGTLQAIVHPLALRLLPFTISCITILLTQRLASRLAGWSAALLAGIILITSIPFYNYASQMRGYGLSMCLYAALGNALLGYGTPGSLRTAGLVALLTAMLLYTLPSNIYYILAMMAIIISYAIYVRRDKLLLREQASKLIAMTAGIAVASLLYVPLWMDMRRLPIFSAGSALRPLEALRERLPVVAYHFLSWRYLLLLMPLVYLIAHRKEWKQWIAVIALVFVLPFALADLRGSSTPYRVFITGLPVLCAAIGMASARVLSRIRAVGWRRAAFLGLAFYCLCTCLLQLRKTDAAALRDIMRGERSGDLYFQYNLHFYHPRRDAAQYLGQFARPSIPLVEACRMDEELLKYLSMAGWNRAAAKKLSLAQSISLYDTVDVLTERPLQLQALPGAAHMQIQLLPDPRSVQIIRLIRRPAS